MSFFDSISRALGTDSDKGALGSIGKSLGLDNDTIASLRLPALAAGAYFGAPYLMNYLGGSAPAAGYGAEAVISGATPGAANMSGLSSGGLLSTLGGAGSTALQALGGSGMLGTLAGGLLGAAAGGDTTTTASKDPWKPAQPFLADNLVRNQKMQDYYAANPFSDEQKTAYQGLLNTNANGMANAAPMMGMANNFMNSRGGKMAPMPQFVSGVTAPQVDWTKYQNIGKGG